PCLQYYIHRCLGPCVSGLTTDEKYAEAARDVRMLLEGRRHDLMKSLQERMAAAAEKEMFEEAASYRDLLRTLEDIEERQRIAATQGDDTDVLAYHEEAPLVAANLFHLRGGRVVDRREFYWEDLEEFDAKEFVVSLLKQLYLEADYLPKAIHVPEEFEDRELLEEMLSERAGHRVEIFTPQRGAKRAVMDLVKNNAAHSFEQRFRVLKPTSKAIGEALQGALNLAEEPERIECFDISHIQGSDTVASMVVWEKGRMKKGDYRKFIIRGLEDSSAAGGEERAQIPDRGNGKGTLPIYRQNDDFASMREVVTRRYRRVQEEKKPMPSLVLIDGGIGQLHAAAEALEGLGIINQPLASIAKKEEILYVYGQENEPVVLERHSPVLHLIQQIRDETHRFAVSFHRLRRGKRQTKSALREIPGVGEKTAQRLLREFGSVANVKRAGVEKLSGVISRKSAEKVLEALGEEVRPLTATSRR
ncbi:MAG TPA: helix-hairpin-helix domain-containing protein, partial [Candidatus Acidoferrum sp.]|nr:helix-hairpin-helix domain-containing protein [Candidatus Acidoferrum sp.]